MSTNLTSWDPKTGGLDLVTLRRAFDAGLTPSGLINAVYDRIEARGEDAVWITLFPRSDALARASELEAKGRSPDQPFWGIPFGIKDNFYVEGVTAYAAVKAWGIMPEETSPTIQALLDAGAIAIGTQNMDQLGMGLVGVRTDFGVPSCVFDADYISGGSSSGGGVSVAAGLVSFAAANDAAGSGRVPPALNAIVGYKPTPGLVPRAGRSNAGMCGTDNMLTLTVADAVELHNAWFKWEPSDPYSKPEARGFRIELGEIPSNFRFAIPDKQSIFFDGDAEAARLFALSIKALEEMGGTAVEVDVTPYLKVARMLYEGVYIAQRHANFHEKFDANPTELCAATAEILSWATKWSASDVFKQNYIVHAAKQQFRLLLEDVDFLLTPTTPTTYKIAELQADNIRLNANMGTYTNFVNLMDLPAISVPAGRRADGMSLGTMLIGGSLQDQLICRMADALQRHMDLPIGAAGRRPSEIFA